MRSSSCFKTISQILILAMLNLCWLTSYGYAEMVPTESAVQAQDDRQRILDLLDRQEVVDELEKYGVSKVEATVRINSLSDEEVTKIAGKLDELPAGGIVKEFYSIFMGLFFLVIGIPVTILCFFGITTPTNPDYTCLEIISSSLSLITLGWKYSASASSFREDCPFAPDGTRICAQPWDYNKSGPESSDEMQEATQCYSKCFDNYHACINSDDEDSPPESQCEEDKQACFQQCEGEEEIEKVKEEEISEKVEQEPGSVMVEEECDPGMESCT